MVKFWIALLVMGLLPTAAFAQLSEPSFYAPVGSENVIVFEHEFDSDFTSLEKLQGMSQEERDEYVEDQIKPLMKFLFGPGTYRAIGSPQRNDVVMVHWNQARIENGHVVLPYRYIGTWILDLAYSEKGQFAIPVPRSYQALFTAEWKGCTDRDPEHATESFFWYFWDPSRPGCDHKEGLQFDNVTVNVGTATISESLSYPEYGRMFRNSNGEKALSLTVAFGYVEDKRKPDPQHDGDIGAYEYRQFLTDMRKQYPSLREQPISMKEYAHSEQLARTIGSRFTGKLNGVPITLNVVINAGIDQMLLFAKSFAHDHDGFFAWMGHSRVGSGFDALQFRAMLRAHPEYYSVTEQYQLIYWGGCNSYSYYTLPFFQFKSDASDGRDPFGTKNLDILAHGLPSLFVLNTPNAEVVTGAILNWPARTSYQSITRDLEAHATKTGVRLLAVVLGDEDNAN